MLLPCCPIYSQIIDNTILLLSCLVSIGSVVIYTLPFLLLIICIFSLFLDHSCLKFINFITLFKESTFGFSTFFLINFLLLLLFGGRGLFYCSAFLTFDVFLFPSVQNIFLFTLWFLLWPRGYLELCYFYF